jgi:hypothetical protein
MKIPKTLRVGGHTIKVDCSKTLSDRAGDWDPTKNLIRLSKDLTQSQREVTLFHELFHAFNSELDNLNLGHVMLEGLSQQLYQVLADNKLLK